MVPAAARRSHLVKFYGTEKLVLVGLAAFLLSPYWLVILASSTGSMLVDFSELTWALENTLAQAVASAIGALAFALPLTAGLLAVSPGTRWGRLLRFLVILPAFLPVLFVLVALLAVVSPFPVGTIGVSLVHSYLYTGLVAVALERSAREHCGGMVQVAVLLGARSTSVFWLLLRWIRIPMVALLFFVFAASFTSFSVPVVVGGGHGTTLEILIFEKIRISQDSGQALALSLIQLLFLGLFSLALTSFSSPGLPTTQVFPDRLLARAWMLAPVLYVFLVMFGFLSSVAIGIPRLMSLPGLIEEVLQVLPYSLFLSLTSAACVAGVLALSALAWPQAWFRGLFLAIVAPSTALVGWALSNVGSAENPGHSFYVLGFVLLSVGGLYRLQLDSQLIKLAGQMQVARSLGASEWRLWRQITLPQIAPTLGHLAGLAGLWAMGDFALSKLLFRQDFTLALLAEGLLSSYRLEPAAALSFLILVLGCVVYTLCLQVGNVIGRRAI